MDQATAQQVARLTQHALGQLNEAILVVQASCPSDEFEAFKKAVGSIMGATVINVHQPLYAAHPDIVPPELR